MTVLHQLSAVEIRQGVALGTFSAVEVARAALDRIAALSPARGARTGAGGLNALLHVDGEGALAAAAAVDRARKSSDGLGPLAGVPVVLKDNLCARGTPTTCASKILDGWVAPYDATAISRLRAAGAVIVGKANMDEFAMGSSNENSAFGPVENPWDAARVPGGSSGGSAASVAAGLAPLALGSDTGGSVRQPGSFSGLVATKPTYGRVSRYGLIAFASSLDQIGPFSRDVRSSARVCRVIAGHDPRDATSAAAEVPDWERSLDGNVKGLRVGVLRSALSQGCEPGVVRVVEEAIERLRAAGCAIVDVDLPTAEHAIAAYYILAPAECSSNLARFDGMRYGPRAAAEDLTDTYEKTRGEGFGPEVKRRIMLGTYVLSAGYYDAYYARAQKARTLLVREFAAAFERCDAVLGPTSPTVAFELGARTKSPLEMYLADVFTLPASLAGLPSISVPAGLAASQKSGSDKSATSGGPRADAQRPGLPVGVQLTTRAFDEATMFRLAHALELATDPSARTAPVLAAAGGAS